MAKAPIYGRISDFWPIRERDFEGIEGREGIVVQFDEQRGSYIANWELEVYDEADLDFEGERDGLTLPERAFILGAFLGAHRR